MATVQASESEAFTKVYPDAGKGQMLSSAIEFRWIHSINGLALLLQDHSLELKTIHSRES